MTAPSGPNPYGPPPYPQADGYGYPSGGFAPRDHPDGTMVLILGILGLVLCGALAPFAWIKGNSTLEEIDRNPSNYSNRSMVNTGRILGIVGTVLMIVWVLFAVAYVLFFVVLVASSGSTT